eukprot:1979081-Pyramimonas_sp.AAC.1
MLATTTCPQVRILSVDNTSCVGYSAEDWNWDILRTYGCTRGEVGVAEQTNVEWDGKDVLWNVVRNLYNLEPTIKGVSLGGWLVLEKWMTPTIFSMADDAPDQWSWSEKLGYDRARELLDYHFSQFLNLKDDMAWLAQHNFTAVRIPVGYWMFLTKEELQNMGVPYTAEGVEYLDAAFTHAEAQNLDVVVCMHGAPGSQNGMQESGHVQDQPQWTEGDNIEKTLQILETVVRRYT